MSYYIKARIISTRPWTGLDEVIEQIVVVELTSGMKLGLFDNFVIKVTPEMVGQIKDIAIIIPVAQIKIINKEEVGIIPSPQDPLHFRHHKFNGKVIEVGVKDIWHPKGYPRLVSVDVGIGEILIDFNKDIFKIIKAGDYVSIDASMACLLDVR